MIEMFSTLHKFRDARVVVLGDVMLDRYWWGEVTRISPEAPVPVVRLKKSSVTLGGAANVAANIAGLGGAARLVGCVGNDAEGALFPEMCQKIGVDYNGLVRFDDRPTTVKTRIIAHSQQVARVDQETAGPISPGQEDELIARVAAHIKTSHALAISDYAKGLLTDRVLSTVIREATAAGLPVLVDPKGRDYSKYSGATLITPNRREAAQACNLDDLGGETVELAGRQLVGGLGFESVLITQGEEGMTLFRKNSDPVHFHATARDVYDVTGAGDTVIAALATALSVNVDLPDAVEIANAAAGLAVEKIGTTIVTAEMLRAEEIEKERRVAV